MSTAFHAFDYLAYIIPGAVLLCGVFWLSPELKAPGIEARIDLGGFGIFVILAFVAGLLIHSVAHYVPEKWVMQPFGLVHRTDAMVCSQQQLNGEEIRKAIGEKLKVDMDSICTSKESEPKELVLRRIFADEQKSGAHRDRVELFETRYYTLLALAATFIILIPISLVFRPSNWANVAFLLVAAILSMERTAYFDGIYARELIQSFLGV